ncbi:MAG: amino acid permease, partial [Isosphaeraceae bacterium]
MSRTKIDDIRDLAGFGYRQELDRSLGSFSSFAAGFSYISILTGVFQMFSLGFAAAGPAFFWTWPVVFLGQLTVGLGFAELAAHYPLSGGVYQWSKRAGSPGLGWMTGWVYLACAVISLAAVALALQASLPQIAPAFQVFGDGSDETDRAKNAVLLGCTLIGLT